jgi:hypothetical protein
MTLRQLREESELHPKCLRATKDTVSEFHFALMDQEANLIPSSALGSRMSFKHGPTGRWSIQIRTQRDTKDAINACLAIWGREQVQIEKSLLDRIGGTTAGSPVL